MATQRSKSVTATSVPATNVAEAAPTGPKIRWDDTHMHSGYANVCNVASTREEVVLLFGINQAWHAGQQEIPIQLSNRIIMSPHVAKRMAVLLENVLKEHESRFGSLPDSRA
jgi:hypothetical protein